MWNVLVPHPCVWRLRIGRGVLAAEVPPKGAKGPGPTPGSQPRVPVPGRDVPSTSGCKNQRGWWLSGSQGCGSRGHPLKGPSRELTADGLPCPELQH